MQPIRFTVIGKPEPKGAHTSFVPTKGNGAPARRPNGSLIVVTKDSNPRMEPAQNDVEVAAIAERERVGCSLLLGPVAADVTYYFTRNKGDYGTGRNANVLKDSAPAFPVTKADIDKLERLVFDALTGTLLRDDKQVVECSHRKRFAAEGEPARIEVELVALDTETVGPVVADGQLAIA